MVPDELRALLQGCKDAPDDDTPRFILADWLDDNGQSDRAEFVRLSVRVKTNDVLPGDRAAMLGRLQALYAKHRHEWLPERAEGELQCVFRRGLIEVKCRVEALRRIDLLFSPDVLPWLEALELDYGQQKAISTLLSLDALRHFTALDVSDVRLSSLMLAELVNSPRVAHLTRLKIAPVDAQKATGTVLARAKHLGGLRVLDILEGMGDGALVSLADAPWFKGLSTLKMRYPSGLRKTAPAWAQSPHVPSPRCIDWYFGQPGKGFRALADSPLLAQVEDLRLECSEIGTAEIEALSSRREWPRLQRLVLTHNQLDVLGMQTLAGMHFPALRSLTLARNKIDHAALCELLAAPWLHSVEHLDLMYNFFDEDCVHSLATSPALANLRHLSLSASTITGTSGRALANSPHLARLESLDVWNQGDVLGDEALTAMLKSTNLPALNALTFRSELTAGSVRRLASSRLARRLRQLSLNGNDFGDEGVTALATRALSELTDLDLSFTRFGKKGAVALAAARFPKLARLCLRGCGLGDAEVRALLQPSAFGSLVLLDLWNPDYNGPSVETMLAWPRIHQLARLTAAVRGNDPALTRLWRTEAFALSE